MLVDEGLAAAVDALADEGPVPITARAMPEQRLDGAVEAAAYFLIAATIRRSQTSGVEVRAEHRDGRLVVDISATGALDDDLVDLEDRLGALDGELTIDRAQPGRVGVRAEVPCAS